MLLSDTSATGFGLVPGSIFSAAQNIASSWFHQVARVTAVGHSMVEGKFSSQIDAIGDGPRVATTDHWKEN